MLVNIRIVMIVVSGICGLLVVVVVSSVNDLVVMNMELCRYVC